MIDKKKPDKGSQNALVFEEIFSESDIQYCSKLRKQAIHDLEGRGLALPKNVL